MRETIARQDELSIEVSDEPSSDYLSLLRSVEFGSDALRYRRVDVEEHVRRLGDSFYFVIRRGDRAAGIFALTPCELCFDNEIIHSVYRSQLCVADAERRRGVARLLRNSAIDWIRQRMSNQPFLAWGCVDESNTKVLALLESQGGLKLGTLSSYLCYRQWPRLSPDVIPLDHRPTTHSNAQLTIHKPRSSSSMIADDGVSASVDSVAVELRHYGHVAEQLYRYLLRYVGPARRRFNPSEFRYAKLSNLEFRGRNPSSLNTLIHHSMATFSTHYAVIVCDPRAVDEDIRRSLGRFVHTTPIAVIAENFGVMPQLISRIQEHPLHLAPMDI